jgi:hypothetical protein
MKASKMLKGETNYKTEQKNLILLGGSQAELFPALSLTSPMTFHF